jgi:hypothetical protein
LREHEKEVFVDIFGFSRPEATKLEKNIQWEA